MKAVKTAKGTRGPGHEEHVRPLWATFRNILLVVFLIFVFAVVQMVTLRRVCNSGMATADSLQHQGLPTLDELARLQEHLALFRLYSYECLFAQEEARAKTARAAEDMEARMLAELDTIKTLLPSGDGVELATDLSQAINDLDAKFRSIRGEMDSDFAAAMKGMDQEIPPLVARVAAAAGRLRDFGATLSGQEANATFGSFDSISRSAVVFGLGNISVAFGAVVFVLLAARRSRAKLTDTLGRLDERTRELAESVSLINATLESTPDGVLALDRTGKILAYNQNFVRQWGLQEHQMTTRSVDAILALCSIQIKNADPFIQRIKELQTEPEKEYFDVIEFQDGRTIERLAKPQWVGESCVGSVINFRDITDRKRAEEALAYERDLLRSLLDHSPDFIYFKDRDSRFLKCSRRLAERFGLDNANAVQGTTDFDYFDDAHARPAFEDEQEVIRTGEPLIGKVEKEVYRNGDSPSWALTTKMPLRDRDGQIIGTIGISKDITAMKQAEADLERAHRQLIEASRTAGMAEVATSVLHNVGNVLNSVNISANELAGLLAKSKISNVTRLGELLEKNAGNLAEFFNRDPAGQQLPAYVKRLAGRLDEERDSLIQECELIRKNIDHIKDIVTMQQSYAKACGMAEKIKVTDLIEDALRLNAGALVRHDVKVERKDETPDSEVTVEKHKVLQILVNLIRNAKYACDESGRTDKHLGIYTRNGGDRIRIEVVDNGVGIPPENLTRIFSHGFTTRKDGHGFGLHSAVLAAKEMGGELKASSDGPQRGATFTLELPTASPENSQ